MRKVILLDLDGTIGDTQSGIKRSVNYALKNVAGYELADDQLNEFIGPPIFDALVDANTPPNLIDDVIDTYRQVYARGIQGDSVQEPYMLDSQPYPGVEELLIELQKLDYIVITGTSKPEPWARQILQRFGFTKYLTEIEHLNVIQTGQLSDSVQPSAHHTSGSTELVQQLEHDGVFGASVDKSRVQKAQVLEYALQAVATSLEVSYDDVLQRALLVGDRHHDVNGARKVGIPVVGCLWGYAREHEIDNADYLIRQPLDLLPILERIFN
jgi:phosphoglycolate phosphatase